MTSYFHSVVTFEHKSGLPRDRMSNSWTFSPSGTTDDDKMDTITDALEEFYNEAPGGGTPLTNFLSVAISRGVTSPTVKHYKIDGHELGGDLGSPLRTDTFSALLGGASSGAGLPSEVCGVLSFRGPYGPEAEFAGDGSRPRARRRGRVFLGPLTTACIETMTADGRTRLSDAFRLTVVRATNQLMNNRTDASWHVWSRKDGIISLVTQAWVDDAPDTQRRRGETAVLRQTVDHI